MRAPHLLLNKIIYPSKYRLAKKYRKIDNYNIEEITAIRLEKLNSLVENFNKMPFYKEYLGAGFRGIDKIENIKSLPIIDKQFIRDNLEIIKRIDDKAVLRSTSGSTGDNFFFYIPKFRRAAAAGALHDFLHRIGIIDPHGKTIGIWGGNLHKLGEYEPIISRLKYLVLDTKLLPGYGMNEAISIEYIKKINKEKPTFIYGYPTYLDILAKFGLKNNIKPHKPKAIVVSGEQLTENAKLRIEKYFNMNICNRYGSVEFGVIAHEINAVDGMYINPLRYIIESDENSELIITDLDNYVTPFIRYKIGDMGEITQKGNWQILKNIKGRTNDVIETKSGKIIPSQFFTILSRVVNGIEKYQFVQISDTKMEMRLIVSDDFNPNDIEIIKKKFSKKFGDEIELSVKLKDKLESTAAGKHKFVIKKG